MKHTHDTYHCKIYELVARLRSEGTELSRNRNFDMFESPKARRALRVHLLLRKVEEALLHRSATTQFTLRCCENDVIELCFEDEAVRYRRTVYLNPAEVALLCEHSEVARLLQSHGLVPNPPVVDP